MLIVMCPSRGRPQKAREAFESFIATKRLPSTTMIFLVDEDDPYLPEYTASLPVKLNTGEGGGMGPVINGNVETFVHTADILGFIGDDHRFRTPDWDVAVTSALSKGGIAYGNDLSRPDLPTQVFISSRIVAALGWFCLPGALHLYLDDTWATLGNRADCLHYLEDVVIEHVHPVYGKAESDEGYQRVNHPSVYSHDGQIYAQWLESGQADKDAATVRSLLAK